MSAQRHEYQIVPYEPRHRADVVRLRNVFAVIAEEWNEVHFRWQQEDNPSFREHLIYLALLRGEVVGMRVLQPAEWEVGDPPLRFRAPCFAGTAMRPEHRNRGLFKMLTEAAESDLVRRGYEYAFNLAASPASYMSSLAEGWRAIGPLQPLIRHQRISGNRLPHRLARKLVRLAAKGRPRGKGLSISTELRCEEAASLVARRRGDPRIRAFRSALYLRWRFRDPSSTYDFLQLERDGQLTAYMALQRKAPPLPLSAGPLNIADWAVADPGDWKPLLGAAIRYAESRQQPLVVWSATLSDFQTSSLRESGFEKIPGQGPLGRSRPTVLVRKLGDDREDWRVGGLRIDDVRSWDLQMIDSDWY